MLKFIFSRAFLIQLVIAVALVGLGIVGAYFFLVSYTKAGETVEVPDMEGFDIVEAEAVLKEAGLMAEVVDSLYSADERGGVVLEQDPRANSTVKKERRIYLTISRYKTPTVEIPNVLNQTSAIAINKLTRRGFEIGEMIPEANPCNGCAIRLQIKGKPLKVNTRLPKGTRIDLVVGQEDADAIVSVPMLYGLTLEECKEMLNRYKLNLGSINYEEDVESDIDSTQAIVYLQSEKEGSVTQMGTAVGVRLTLDQMRLPDVNIDSIKASLK